MTGPIERVCVRAEHHRHLTRAPVISVEADRVHYCPAGAADGHLWMAISPSPFEAFEQLGWTRCATRLSRAAGCSPANALRLLPDEERSRDETDLNTHARR